MKIEPETQIDKAIAAAWPERWAAANAPTRSKSGWASNAKRRNRLRRQWALFRHKTLLTDILPHYEQTKEDHGL